MKINKTKDKCIVCGAYLFSVDNEDNEEVSLMCRCDTQ